MAVLTFFRINPDIRDPSQIILNRNDSRIRVEPVVVDGLRIGFLYIRRSTRDRPSWVKYFGPSVDLEHIQLGTSSIAALLLVELPDAFYAVVFGYGASLLCDGVVEERFGLRATLNAVEATKLRSIDHKRLEAISRHTREQLSRDGALSAFGLDIHRDLLRSVTGAPRDSTYGKRLTGSDQLTVTADVPLSALTTALGLYQVLSEGVEYRRSFPWVDNIHEVRDGSTERRLLRRLAVEIENRSDLVWVAPPELIDWSNTLGFRYKDTRKKEPYVDLNLDDYFNDCGGPHDLRDGNRLKGDRVLHIRREDDTRPRTWSFFRCLVGELELDGQRFVLSEGVWYQIDRDFLASLDNFIAGVPTAAIDLPPHVHGEIEPRYNERAWARNKSQLALLDRNLVPVTGRGGIEACDLYTKQRQFVHVKRIDRSSTLSHLFNQGTVAAELVRDSEQFRAEFLERIPGFEWGHAADAIKPNDFEVCYAIIQRKGKSLELPFFSKLTLRNAIQALNRLGFRSSTIGIPSE